MRTMKDVNVDSATHKMIKVAAAQNEMSMKDYAIRVFKLHAEYEALRERLMATEVRG